MMKIWSGCFFYGTPCIYFCVTQYDRYYIGDGVLFSIDFFVYTVCIFLSFFLCFFVSNITRKRLDRFAWNFQGSCGVTMGRPDYIWGQFEQMGRRVKGHFVISEHSYLLRLLFSCSPVLPSSDCECNDGQNLTKKLPTKRLTNFL